MSFRLSILRIGFGAAVLALSGLLACSAQAQGRQRGRSIEFTEPRSDEVTTNLNQLTSKKDGLRELEEDLYKPLQSFAPKSSLEGVMAPPPRAPAPSAIQSKRVRELLERRRNWVFMTPEDLLSGPTVEQILKAPEYGADGQEKKELPALDRYYQRLVAKRPARNSLTQPKDDDLFNAPKKSNPPDVSPARDDSSLPTGLKESAEALRRLSQADEESSPFSHAATPSSLADPFRLASKAPAKEQMIEHKKLMDDYRTMMDPSWHPATMAKSAIAALGPGDAAQPSPKPATGLPGTSITTTHKKLDAQIDITHPLLGPPGLPDVNAQALGQPRSAPTLPKVQERTVALPAPVVTAPKRAF